MRTAEPARRLSRAATTALRELPGNTAWLLAKALEPAASTAGGASRAMASAGDSVSETASTVTGTAGAAASGIRRKTKAARRSVAEALPGTGHDPVASLLQQADAAAAAAAARAKAAPSDDQCLIFLPRRLTRREQLVLRLVRASHGHGTSAGFAGCPHPDRFGARSRSRFGKSREAGRPCVARRESAG